MKKGMLALVALGLLMTAVAGASTVTIVRTPADYDSGWGENPPRDNFGDAPVGWGSGSVRAPATGKTNYHIMFWDDLALLFPNHTMTVAAYEGLYGTISGGGVPTLLQTGLVSNLTIGDISSVSFWTELGADTTQNRAHDFWLTMYTNDPDFTSEPGGSVPGVLGNDYGWYESRLHARPDYAGQYSSTDWNQWSTNESESNTNQLRFYDSRRSAEGTPKPLEQYTDGTGRNYSAELIRMFTIQTDSVVGGWDNYFDGLTITLTDGSIGRVDFQPVPEPASMAILGMGLVGLVATRMWKRQSV